MKQLSKANFQSISWMIKVMYILGFVFAGLITAAFFILSLNSPVYLVCDALVEVLWLLCIVYIYIYM